MTSQIEKGMEAGSDAIGALPAVEVLSPETLPSRPECLVANAGVHVGCAVALWGTNGKLIGWIDTHAWTKGRVYRDQLLRALTATGESKTESSPEVTEAMRVLREAGCTTDDGSMVIAPTKAVAAALSVGREGAAQGQSTAYQVTAIMNGRRTRLVVADGDPYTTTNLAEAERVLAQVRKLPSAYIDARIESSRASALTVALDTSPEGMVEGRI